MERIFSTGEVAKRLGVPAYRITYAISTGQLEDASFRFLDKRCFTASEIERIAEHFGVEAVQNLDCDLRQPV